MIRPILKFTAQFLFLLIILLSALPTIAQKRKKGETNPYYDVKLRESEFYFTEGEKYFILEDFAKALVYYQRALESNPTNATIHYKIADVLARSNKPDDLQKAAISIERAIDLENSNKFFYITAATIYNSAGNFQKAAEAYERMLSSIKGTEEYLYEVAAVYQYAGKPNDAIDAYDRAETYFGVNETSSVQKIRLYLDQGKTEEAITEGEKLVNAFPDEERYIMAFAEILSQKGMQQQAITYVEKFVTENPDALDASMLLAGFYRDTNQELKARPLLEKLFDSENADLPGKLIVLGAYNAELNGLRSQGGSDADKAAFALKLFNKLKKTNPDDATVHIVGGDLFLSTGKQREAQREYLIAAQSGEVNFEVWENLIYLEMQLEEYANVVTHSEEALELFPNHSMIHYFNGYAHLKLKQLQEAVFSFDQAKRLAGSNKQLITEVNTLLGDTYHAMKDYEKSDKAFDDALLLDPLNETALNNYSFYLAERKADLDKAEKMASTLAENHPENPAYLDTYAWVLYAKEKFKDARKVIEKAILTGQASATHFEHYGDILYKLGDVDGAVTQWEKARGMNANREILNQKIANRKIYE